ncbi:MAG: diphthine--ammonia ligase [Candidatus Micrarchaeota archaeon]
MRVAALFSGGKDSVCAVHWAIRQGHDVILLTANPPEYSMMFHHPNIGATKLQAESLGLKQVFIRVSEDDWRMRIIEALKGLGVGAIVSGAVESSYQKKRLDDIAQELGIESFAPLWHKGPELMGEMLRDYQIVVIAVSAEGLGPEFLGEPLEKLIRAKKPNVHLFLEGGEGETFVTDAPLFKKRIMIKKWKKTWDGVRGVAHIEEAVLIDK